MPGHRLAGSEAGQGLRHGLPYGFERAGGLGSTVSFCPSLWGQGCSYPLGNVASESGAG